MAVNTNMLLLAGAVGVGVFFLMRKPKAEAAATQVGILEMGRRVQITVPGAGNGANGVIIAIKGNTNPNIPELVYQILLDDGRTVDATRSGLKTL